MTSVNHGTTVCDQMDSHRSDTAEREPSLSVISAVIQLLTVTTVTVSTRMTRNHPVRSLISSTPLEPMEAGTMEQLILLVLSVLTTRHSLTMIPHSVTVGILLMPVGFPISVITVCTVTQKPKLPRTGLHLKHNHALTVQTVTLVLTYLMSQTTKLKSRDSNQPDSRLLLPFV